jgi:hypothetical protein
VRGPSTPRKDLTVDHPDVRRVDLPTIRSDRDQSVPGRRSRSTHDRTCVRHRPAAERPHVEGAEIGVTHHKADTVDRQPKFTRDEPTKCGAVVLADVDLPDERRDLPIAADMDPSIARRGPAPLVFRTGVERNNQSLGKHGEVVPIRRRCQVPRCRRAPQLD